MNTWKLSSPNGEKTLVFHLNKSGRLFYDMMDAGQALLLNSPIWFELDGEAELREGFAYVMHNESAHSDRWANPWGENRIVCSDYTALEVTLCHGGGRTLTLQARAYAHGVAWRYVFGGGGAISIRNERTCFRLAGNGIAHCTYTAQGSYKKRCFPDIGEGCERPLVVELDTGACLAICEAALVDYARMKLDYFSDKTVVSALSAMSVYPDGDPPELQSVPETERIKYSGPSPLTTPWRVVMSAQSPAALYMGKDMLLDLNEPCALEDTSFIRPGKVLRVRPLTTENGYSCVDFAHRHAMQYIEIDTGWYGPEGDSASDARTVTPDPRMAPGPFDLFAILARAKDKGIGVILYINHRAVLRQLDELLPLYRKWGVAGIKFGFVDVGPQKWTGWLHECVRKAGRHVFVLTIHDEYRPTGYSRTWPNLLTQEGIRGDEERQPVSNHLETVFTRMLAGAGDHTVCYFDPRVDELWSHALQLAKAVVMFSPLQFLYWYDNPAIIQEVDELRFFDALPTVWDETRVLDGRIGEFVVMARRSGEDWFVGVMNADAPRAINVPLHFLQGQQVYCAEVFYHDEGSDSPTHVASYASVVRKEETLHLSVQANSGVAIWILPWRHES